MATDNKVNDPFTKGIIERQAKELSHKAHEAKVFLEGVLGELPDCISEASNEIEGLSLALQVLVCEALHINLHDYCRMALCYASYCYS